MRAAGGWSSAKEEWRGEVRHVLEIAELKDVCVAVDPAVYPQAQVEYRTQPEATQKEVEMDQQAQQEGGHAVSTPEQHDDESRALLPAGSLRVEERAEVPLVRSLADLYEQRGCPSRPLAYSCSPAASS
jgi:hypothetical protein